MLITSAETTAPTIRRADDARPERRRRVLRLVPVKYPRPMHHATKVMPVEGMPGWSARVLFLRKFDGEVEAYAPLVLYMARYWTRSSTWQDTVARGVGLFWDFCQAHFLVDQKILDGSWRREALNAFGRALLMGTVDDGVDPLGLFWPCMPYGRVKLILGAIENYLDWCHHRQERPLRAGDRKALLGRAMDGMAFSDLLIWSRVRRFSTMEHVAKPKRIGRSSDYDIGKDPHGFTVSAAKHFPDKQAPKLVFEGHRRPRKSTHGWNIRDQMIALLCRWGGLRRSEPLHLYVGDVGLDPDPERHGCALVVLHHPAFARITFRDILGSKITATRQEYLKQRFGLLPRHVLKRGRYHVGWKGMLLDKQFQTIVHWLDVDAGRVFFQLYRTYVTEVWPRIMNLRTAAGMRDHPFLFLSEGPSRHGDDASIGDPYSMAAYERNHAAAVRRMGLVHGKYHGTTTHGLRHAYGQSLMDLKLGAPEIQAAMRHRSALSQIVYTMPGPEKTSRIINAASKGLAMGTASQELPGSESSRALLELHRSIASGGYRG